MSLSVLMTLPFLNGLATIFQTQVGFLHISSKAVVKRELFFLKSAVQWSTAGTNSLLGSWRQRPHGAFVSCRGKPLAMACIQTRSLLVDALPVERSCKERIRKAEAFAI